MKLSLHAIRYMSIENPTLAHFRHFSSLFTPSLLYICRESSTNHLFLCKTKPILSAVGGLQMNINLYVIEDYKNETTLRPQKKQTQFKANFNYPQRAKTEVRYLSSAFCFLSSVQGPQAQKQSICVLKKSAKRFDFGG